MKNLFPLRRQQHKMDKRNDRKFETKQINTKRYANSALPYLRKLLNIDEDNNRRIIRNI